MARNPGLNRAYTFGVQRELDAIGRTAGSVFYVDSGAANTSDNNAGTSWDKPMATIDAAIAKCTATSGDIIFVAPGHAETIAGAAGLNMDIAGVTIIGLGNDADRPTLTLSATASTIAMAAADCKIKNIKFILTADPTIVVDINAAGCTVEGCDFPARTAATAREWVTAIDVNGGAANACDRTTIRGNRFISTANAGATQAIELGEVADSVLIEGNWIDGDFSNAGIHSGAVLTNLVIKDNIVRNRQTGDHAIELTAACTGELVDNRMFGDTLGTILDPGSLFCAGNLESDAIDQAGVASPRVAAGGLPDDSITAASIATGAITNAKFAAGAIDATAIANGAIDAATFAAGAIDAAAIANSAIDANTFAAGAIDSAAIATGAIDADAIAASSFTATKFAGSVENCVEKSDGAMLNGADDIFTITGGPVYAMITGIVTTVIGGNAGTLQLQETTTAPAATANLSTAVNVETDAAGTSYRFVGATGVLTPDTAGAKIVDPVTVADCWYLLPIGTVKVNGSAANTGVIAWYMRYKPLSPSSVVVAAA